MRGQESVIFKVIKGKKKKENIKVEFDTQQKYFKNEDEIKSTSDIQKLEEFIMNTSVLQEALK